MLVLLVLLPSAVYARTELSNERLVAVFDEKRGTLTSLKARSDESELIASSGCSLWQLLLVSADGPITLESSGRGAAISRQRDGDTQTLTLTWKDLNIIGAANVDVQIAVTLRDNAQYFESSLEVEAVNVSSAGPGFGLWESSLSLKTPIGTSEDGDIFYPAGLGRSFLNPSGANSATSGNISAIYPSGGA